MINKRAHDEAVFKKFLINMLLMRPVSNRSSAKKELISLAIDPFNESATLIAEHRRFVTSIIVPD